MVAHSKVQRCQHNLVLGRVYVALKKRWPIAYNDISLFNMMPTHFVASELHKSKLSQGRMAYFQLAVELSRIFQYIYLAGWDSERRCLVKTFTEKAVC
jgi:hypothetical protein